MKICRFYKSINTFISANLYSKIRRKNVILSHSIYLPAIIGRITLNKVIFTLSLIFIIISYIKNFLKIAKKSKREWQKGKIDLNSQSYSSENIENLDHSPLLAKRTMQQLKVITKNNSNTLFYGFSHAVFFHRFLY